MALSTTWRDQYDRMVRTWTRLRSMASGYGEPYMTADGRGDIFYHFCQDAYHLKDWLINDPAVDIDSRDIEGLINDSLCLKIVADLANGAKHLTLKRPRTGDLSTSVTDQYAKSMRRRDTGNLRSFAYTTWWVESGGRQYDGHELAGEVLATWQNWLEGKGLLS